MALRIPARNVVGDQIMESVANANSREEQVMRIGGSYPITAVTGTITTSTGAVTATTVTPAGTLLVMVYGTHAGLNLTFEALDSAGGNTNWVPLAGSRVNTPGWVESVTGVLPSNAIQAWRFPIARFDQFRVRATAYTSGTLNVIVDPSVPWGEPVVSSVYSPAPGRAIKSVYLEGEAGVNADTIIATLGVVSVPGAAPTTAQTSVSVTAGKTFRITSLSFSIYVTTATTPPWARIRLRFNPSGAGAIGSNLVNSWTIAPNNTTLNAGGVHPVALPPEGIELTASATANGGFAFSKSGPATTPANCAINMQLYGYEYG